MKGSMIKLIIYLLICRITTIMETIASLLGSIKLDPIEPPKTTKVTTVTKDDLDALLPIDWNMNVVVQLSASLV